MGRYRARGPLNRARDPWAIPGPGPGATQTTGCASERLWAFATGMAGRLRRSTRLPPPPGVEWHVLECYRVMAVCAVGRASGRDGLAWFDATDAATHPAPDRTRVVRCVRVVPYRVSYAYIG